MSEEIKLHMTAEELSEVMERLRLVFDIVRVIDPLQKKQFDVGNGGCMECSDLKCYFMWNRKVSTKCENCSSSRAITNNSKETKFEFMDDEIFHVVSHYIEVDGKPLVLELMNHINDETLLDANGSNTAFVESITNRNRMIFTDPLTGAYNRRHYEEQVRLTHLLCGVAMLDVDNFKGVNDTFGHGVGDTALQRVVEVCRMYMNEARDAIIRFGGDEFILVCRGIPKEEFQDILENIRKGVENSRFEEFPDMKLTVSIGGTHGVGTVTEMLDVADGVLYDSKVSKNSAMVKDYTPQQNPQQN